MLLFFSFFLIHRGFGFELLFIQLVWSWRAKVSDVVTALALPVKHQTPFELGLSSIYSIVCWCFSWLIFISSNDDVDSSLMFLRWRCWWSIAMVDRGCVAWSLADGPEVGAGDNFSSLCTSTNNMGGWGTSSTNMGAPTSCGHLYQHGGTSSTMGVPSTNTRAIPPTWGHLLP